MAAPENRQTASRDDLQRLAVELADHSRDLRSALTLEVRQVGRAIDDDGRANATHLAELVRGEVRLVQLGLDAQTRQVTEIVRTVGATLATRTTVVSLLAHLFTIAVIAVMLGLAG